ncbi:MAG: magnesium transporter [Gemmatimonadota bacterium]|nr:magnesium transporter [Gemmatimonadota bacterium]
MTNDTKASRALIRAFFHLHPGEAARALASTPVPEAIEQLEAQAGERAAQVFERMDPDRAVVLVENMGEALFQRLWTAMDENVAASILARLSPESRTERLAVLPSGLAGEMEVLMSYPPGSAGQIMDSSVTVFSAEETAEEALTRIRSFPERRIHDLCVVDDDGSLTAVLTLQEVAVAQPGDRLGQLAKGPPVCVQAMSSREEVVELLEAHKLASLPVIGGVDGRLCGIIRHDALVDAARHEASENLVTMVGAGREERALSGPVLAVRKRLPWLQVNLATAFLAAAAVALFEDTIARFTALAIFLPVVAGQAGNTGAQALAVTSRGLALREFRPRRWFRVARKELLAGCVNGVAIALVASLAAYLWSGTPGLPLVLAVSMVFSMSMASLSGALIPIILTALGKDPAQSASIFLTTVTDVIGFVSFLGLATVVARSFGMAL